jgi:glycolate oxidase FAD binding subunit
VTTLVPRNAGDVTDAVRWAAAEGEALEVLAGRTRRTLGRPVDAIHVLDVSALNGVVSYEPEELILTVLPATPLADIEALLASRKQCLAFEPPYLVAGVSTLGGTIATAFSGPRRPKVGSVRDHVLGITAVSGRGELFTGGGKVVKNVTGYDIPKLLTASYGTLAVFTEITVKVLPAPDDTRTLLVSGLTPAEAVLAMTTVLQSTADASGACHLPPGIVAPGKSLNEATTAIRLEGVTPSVEFRLARLRDQLSAKGSIAVLDRDASIAFWKAVRDVAPFAADTSHMLWRISVPPAQGAEILARIERSLPGAKSFLDWGGGLIWLQIDAGAESAAAAAVAQKVRAALSDYSGHATLVRASADVRRAVDVFHPQPQALAALSNRVKSQFDPKQVLNPGRMYAGI